jgi:hypothetical protein
MTRVAGYRTAPLSESMGLVSAMRDRTVILRICALERGSVVKPFVAHHISELPLAAEHFSRRSVRDFRYINRASAIESATGTGPAATEVPMAGKAGVIDSVAEIPMRLRNSMDPPADLSPSVLPDGAHAANSSPAEHVRRRRDLS